MSATWCSAAHARRGDLEQRLEQKLEQRLAPLATKAELEQRLAPLATKAELAQRLAPLATKAELEIWGGALLTRIEWGEQRLLERIDRLEQRFDGLEQRLLTELARHTKAIYESMSMQILVIDEKYADLPQRMSRLETEVFGPKR